MNKIAKKVLLIGWDAADWKIINPLIDQGLMPNLEKFINGGVIGNLATLDPAYSPMLWSSIATGKRPYKHGVLGFTEPAADGINIQPVMSTSRKVKAIWNILTQKNMKSHVVGWWPSHPAEPINGVYISNFYQNHKGRLHDPWPMPKGCVHPDELSDFYSTLRVHPEELTGAHILPFVPLASKVRQQKDHKLFSVAKVTAHAASLHAAFTNIIRTKEWDFAAIYLDAIDHYCHGFMKYHPPKRDHIAQSEYDIYKNVVTSGYRYHDMMLGRTLELAGEDTTVILVSDHGFQPDHLRPRDIPKEPAGPAYEHSPYGVIAMKGPGIKKDEIIYGASLLDITPTLLTLFGLPTAEDMDGKVLVNAFEQEPEVEMIDSWENVPGECGMHSGPIEGEEDISEKALKQLVELGYIDKPDDNPEKRLKNTVDECNINLARAYMDGGLVAEAIPILDKLFEENPLNARYGFRLASCYQMMGKLKQCRETIDLLRERELYETYMLDIMEAGLLVGELQPKKALDLLRNIDQSTLPNLGSINLQIARCYMMLTQWGKAKETIKIELSHNFDNPMAHQMLGIVYLQTKYFKESVESLLQCIGLEYQSPVAHYNLGRALFKMGDYEKSAEAFEVTLVMMPQNNKAREALILLYNDFLDQPERAQSLNQEFDKKIKGTITVVSGLPRSGTSMMMQMLAKGGHEVFTDEERAADDNNPRGYYEHEAVKSLHKSNKWLVNARDKAIKVIAQLIESLPSTYKYKIIFMERDLNEVVTSQRKMLNRLGKETADDVMPLELIQSFEATIRDVKMWAAKQSNVEIVYVKHADVINNPFEQALRINEFLDYKLLPELMAEAVDRKLYREKITET